MGALLDDNADGVIALSGGWNSIELLRTLDFGVLARARPKLVCGMSDITTLTTAFHAGLGWRTIYGPNLDMLGSGLWSDEWIAAYCRMLAGRGGPFTVTDPPQFWTRDTFGALGDGVLVVGAPPMSAIRPGAASGRVFGGHLGTLVLLAGTRFWPQFTEPVVLFVEDDALLGPGTLPEAMRRLEALLLDTALLPRITAVVVGRFEPDAEITRDQLAQALLDMAPLRGIPIVIDAPFGHTRPATALPVGGWCRLDATASDVDLVVRNSIC
jgi:muramoyltetrapeptide carboxypeptidase LdcA involved in peptidoglycan recycling